VCKDPLTDIGEENQERQNRHIAVAIPDNPAAVKLVPEVSNAMGARRSLETHNEAIEQNRNDQVQGGLDQAECGGELGVVEITTDFLLAVLEGVNQSYCIRDHVLSNDSISKKQRSVWLRMCIPM
jgi:hypothetical protein